MPLQGKWWANHPISPQPEGQQPCRARWGVAPLANSQLFAAGCAFHRIPARLLRDPG